MAKLIMLSGLPASYKSTTAKELQSQGQWIRLNRDLLREMLHFSKYTPKNEKMVVNLQKQIARDSLENGINVIVDDCNLNPKNREMWHSIANETFSKFETKRMEENVTYEYVQELCKRDELRGNKVGSHTIWKMALQYFPEILHGKEVIICDLDGTLFDIKHRLHHVKKEVKDWKAFGEEILNDTVREEVREMLPKLGDEERITIFLSGRNEMHRKHTELMMNRGAFGVNCVDDHECLPLVIMREEHDHRPDTEVKSDMYKKYLSTQNVVEVIDDRPSVIEMWRELGLNVTDVGDGIPF